MKISPKGTLLKIFAIIVVAFVVASCARMGNPDGGWYDETPPRVVGASPSEKATNVNAKKVYINFDEFIKVDNPTEKVVVSPPQIEAPEIKAQGKRIAISLLDSLKANTTYTIDFSDAISDNNEGNPLGNYTYSFSTGDHIDTLEVSGHVVQADNLEPVKGILVGLYGEMEDSCFIKKPMLRVARADSRGKFIIRGVAPGNYRIYALQDQDGDYRFSQKAEQIAFTHDSIKPSFCDAIRQDTTWIDSLRIKDIQRVGYTRFTPDDIVLRAFTETLTDRYFLKAERQQADHFSIFFSYGDKQLPEIKGLNFNADNAFLVQSSLHRDTITYWLRDTMLVNQDTLNIQMKYMVTDSLGNLVSQTDTLSILSKQPYERRQKDLRKEIENWQKQQDKKRKRGEPYDSIMKPKLLTPRITSGSSLDPDRNVGFAFDRPLSVVDTSKIHLYARQDTLWYTMPKRFRPVVQKIKGDTINAEGVTSLLNYELLAEWKPDTEYSIEADSMAFVDIYGMVSPAIKEGVKVKSLDEYSSLIFTIPHFTDKPVVVELLNQQDAAVKKTTVIDGTAQFFYVSPGTYYARMFVDDNNNGIWDTGNYAADRQPEFLYYYPEEIECKAKWDVTLNWNPTARPLNEQKPSKIVKQKAEQKQKLQQRNLKRAQQLGIPYPF